MSPPITANAASLAEGSPEARRSAPPPPRALMKAEASVRLSPAFLPSRLDSINTLCRGVNVAEGR